jgi:hypothetical protein
MSLRQDEMKLSNVSFVLDDRDGQEREKLNIK